MRKQCRRATLASHLQCLIRSDDKHLPFPALPSSFQSCLVCTCRSAKSERLISLYCSHTLRFSLPPTAIVLVLCAARRRRGGRAGAEKPAGARYDKHIWGRSPMSWSTRPSRSRSFRRWPTTTTRPAPRTSGRCRRTGRPSPGSCELSLSTSPSFTLLYWLLILHLV